MGDNVSTFRFVAACHQAGVQFTIGEHSIVVGYSTSNISPSLYLQLVGALDNAYEVIKNMNVFKLWFDSPTSKLSIEGPGVRVLGDGLRVLGGQPDLHDRAG